MPHHNLPLPPRIGFRGIFLSVVSVVAGVTIMLEGRMPTGVAWILIGSMWLTSVVAEVLPSRWRRTRWLLHGVGVLCALVALSVVMAID